MTKEQYAYDKIENLFTDEEDLDRVSSGHLTGVEEGIIEDEGADREAVIGLAVQAHMNHIGRC